MMGGLLFSLNFASWNISSSGTEIEHIHIHIYTWNRNRMLSQGKKEGLSLVPYVYSIPYVPLAMW